MFPTYLNIKKSIATLELLKCVLQKIERQHPELDDFDDFNATLDGVSVSFRLVNDVDNININGARRKPKIKYLNDK